VCDDRVRRSIMRHSHGEGTTEKEYRQSLREPMLEALEKWAETFQGLPPEAALPPQLIVEDESGAQICTSEPSAIQLSH